MNDEPLHTETQLRNALWIAFRLGAQGCREMEARFVEQGGDTTTAQSIRLNWNPHWGSDPGAPSENVYNQLQAGFDYGVCIEG
jgi:hypothetical protein